ncbi:membrane protein insertion efficiency factor YidD [Marinomonas sp. UCMA 3892]|uniref:membrane protein insertion efficiency factor YidD n=1 Tax=Marinomonas sp. UCMA 3892 TaxID=1972585 RepID=UPI00146CCC47|nr:membrane protein insertion efficiency factor YidD [Marinomonas sp. UCMA 3892]NLU97396.1 membrane protein insertion efficiency factor YidD [Marinomonas sp. UCMA 3892]
MKRIFILIVKGYQFLISPLLGNNCRFYPSCSHYMIQAIERYGIFKGMYLGLKRLSKCHPWHEGGMDPVPSSCHCKDGKNRKDQAKKEKEKN